jgi:hypothetical protein
LVALWATFIVRKGEKLAASEMHAVDPPNSDYMMNTLREQLAYEFM